MNALLPDCSIDIVLVQFIQNYELTHILNFGLLQVTHPILVHTVWYQSGMKYRSITAKFIFICENQSNITLKKLVQSKERIFVNFTKKNQV